MAASKLALQVVQIVKQRLAASPMFQAAVTSSRLLAANFSGDSFLIDNRRDNSDNYPTIGMGLEYGHDSLPALCGAGAPWSTQQQLDSETDGKQDWESSIWFAVPKRKPSYRKKRMRQMNPLYQNTDVQNFYPCPKCEKGLMKVRHHICPCDQEALNAKSIIKVKYGEAKKDAPAPEKAAAAEE